MINSLKRFIGVEKLGRVKIGNHVMVGAKSIILPNVIIGNNVVIGAGSVVTKNIPDNVVCAGNPARILCSLDDYINKFKGKINSDNLLDRNFSPLCIDAEKREIIKNLCQNGFCYFKANNYDEINRI